MADTDMTLEEALAAATVDDALETSYCTVDDDTRLITIPEKYKKLGVQSDEKAKRVWFRFPKLVGNNGIDLSEIGVRVNFRNANGDGDIYVVEDLTVDGDYVIFSWEITREVTAYKGHISFVVCAVKSSSTGVVKNEWNTTLNKECEVLEGLEVTEQIVQENPDIIEYILANLGGSVSAEQIAEAVEEYMLAHPFTETDPTVPNWAKQPQKPTYTASEVGADAFGTAESKVSEHNVATDAHNDIRLLIQGLTERMNALADSDDETLDQTSEIVAYIKSNKSLIDAITTSKVSVADIVNDLVTNVTDKPLSAAQGVVIKTLIDALRNDKLDAAELTNAVNTALAQAKASGEFDGADGKSAYQYAVEGGYTGTEEEFAAKLAQEQLSGTTSELMPTQVYDAVSAGIPVKVQYIDSTYGLLSFTAFNVAESLNVIVSQTIVYYKGVYILAELLGDKSGNTWNAMFATLAQGVDIPTDDHINSLIDIKLGVIENGYY